MFYSHTFLAKKGPLGTVWTAAHLQNRLKKSNYISVNILKTVEKIMIPEVPIALRMSGHLLLGVVRIYSKQIDYLYEDFNNIRISINRISTSLNVNLPEDATHAPFYSVTLPDRFELDSLNLDEYNKDWGEDSHIKSRDDITLSEQVPTGQDPHYSVITFDEHDLRDSSFVEDNAGSGPVPMDEDVPPTKGGTSYPSPSNNVRVDKGTIGNSNSTPHASRSIEVMRDARHGFDFNNSPILPDRADPDEFLEEQINKDREASTPVTEEVVLPDGRFSSSHNNHGDQQPSFGNLDSPMIFDHQSTELVIRATPPVAEPKVKRKRKHQLYDEATVLSNEHMKKLLNDTSGIRRVKRNCPSTSLDIWKLNNRLKKDGVFYEPFISGSCADLSDMYKEDFISSKPHLINNTEETHQETTNVAQSPISRPVNNEPEVEILRNNEYASPDRYMPSGSTFPSPNGRSYFTPPNSSNFGLHSERLETTDGDTVLPNTDMGASSGENLDSEMRTPDTLNGMGGHTALSDIPELLASPGELRFLEQDDNIPFGDGIDPQRTPASGTPSKNQETPDLQGLSSRTRAVAQFLKRQSLVTPILENPDGPSGDLNLNKILQGKSRKIAARMFAETLVLKNYGLVDVHQESPYNDITLKVTPKLSKGEFSI